MMEKNAFAGDFVSVSAAIPDVLLDIRYYSTYNFVGDRIDGYRQPIAILTRQAAQALTRVNEDVMKKGYRLKIYDAYRPQAAVKHFMRWARDLNDTRMKAYFYPEINKEQIIPQGYVAERSGHSRGSTVDLTLVEMLGGRDADMGGPFDYFGALSHGDFGGVTAAQRENRALLRDVMLSHGFRALQTEWWHFTLQNEPFPDTYFDFPVCEEALS